MAVLIYNCCQDRRKRLEQIKVNKLLISRLEKNWAKVMGDEDVDELSLMPEEWKSGLVPVHSEAGEVLNTKLKTWQKKSRPCQAHVLLR